MVSLNTFNSKKKTLIAENNGQESGVLSSGGGFVAEPSLESQQYPATGGGGGGTSRKYHLLEALPQTAQNSVKVKSFTRQHHRKQQAEKYHQESLLSPPLSSEEDGSFTIENDNELVEVTLPGGDDGLLDHHVDLKSILKHSTHILNKDGNECFDNENCCGPMNHAFSVLGSMNHHSGTPETADIMHQTNKLNHARSKKSLTFSPDLIESIRHFSKGEPPKSVAFIQQVTLQDIPDTDAKSVSSVLVIPHFWFLKDISLVHYQSSRPFFVLLDGVSLNDNVLRIGILTRNISFEKRVSVRLSWSNWDSFRDIPATFSTVVSLSCPATGGQGLDRFLLELKLDEEDEIVEAESAVLQFAIRYQVLDQEYWDNNNQENHQVRLIRPSRWSLSRQNPKRSSHRIPPTPKSTHFPDQIYYNTPSLHLDQRLDQHLYTFPNHPSPHHHRSFTLIKN